MGKVNKFKFQLRYYVHFWTNAPWESYKSSYSFCNVLNNTTEVLDDFGFK